MIGLDNTENPPPPPDHVIRGSEKDCSIIISVTLPMAHLAIVDSYIENVISVSAIMLLCYFHHMLYCRTLHTGLLSKRIIPPRLLIIIPTL